jgi:hypothetical protein
VAGESSGAAAMAARGDGRAPASHWELAAGRRPWRAHAGCVGRRGAPEVAGGHDRPPESRAELLRRLAGIARGAAPAAGRCEPKGVAAGALGGRRLRLLEVRRVRV